MATPCHTTPLSAPLEDGEDLPRARFLNELAARELVHLGHDRFAGEVDAAAAAASPLPHIPSAFSASGPLSLPS